MHNKQKNIRLTAAGEMGLVVEFGQEISPKINASVHQFSQVLRESMPHGILELVPTYCAVTIYFDPIILSRERLMKPESGIWLERQPKFYQRLTQVLVETKPV